MDNPTIRLSYCDLLDILDEYNYKKRGYHPCGIESFAKYIWNMYYEETDDHIVDTNEMVDK